MATTSMEELLLFGQVPSSDALISVLSGLTGMKPQKLIQRHAIYRPKVLPTSNAPVHVGGTQTITEKKRARQQNVQTRNPLYSKLVESLQATDFGRDDEPQIAHEWTNVNLETPLPGERSVTQRKISEVRVQSGNGHERMESQGNVFVSEYITDGVRFTHNAINIYVYQVKKFPTSEHIVTAPRSPLPALDSLELLDSGGASVVEATVRLEHEPSPSLIKLGTDQLLALQRDMKGVVKLVAPERLSLDAKVKPGAR